MADEQSPEKQDGTLVLLPDYQDDPSDFLVSFAGIKQKTSQALYNNNNNSDDTSKASHAYWAMDKSPKGSVDEPIRPLVDLINHHPSFSTLSSCSGRIALFRPWDTKFQQPSNTSSTGTTLETEMLQERIKDQRGTPGSGKGSGGWLMVSHHVIDPLQLLDLFPVVHDGDEDANENKTQSLEDGSGAIMMFKVEPMLLHVAAATLQRGKQLLGLALDLGFRESGLVLPATSEHRVTVAIRGVSLALVVPLQMQGPLRPSNAYLRALVEQANHRLQTNESKLHRLYEKVKETLFRRPPATTTTAPSSHEWQYDSESLPDINLWGHAAVTITDGSCNTDVLVLGGYGQGPSLATEKVATKKQCQRQGNIYRLQRKRGQWDSRWKQVIVSAPACSDPLAGESNNTLLLESLNIMVEPMQLTPREGLAAFSFKGLVLIWGGRTAPRSPLNDLLVVEYSGSSNNTPVSKPKAHILKPLDVRGEIPAPRWGHTLTALHNDNSNNTTTIRLAALVGGRSERSCFDTIHLLSLFDENGPRGSGHFLWEKVNFSSGFFTRTVFPFHHATIAVPGEDDDMLIFVFGGHRDPCNLLEQFTSNQHSVTSFVVSLNSATCEARECPIRESSELDDFRWVGGAVTCLKDISGKTGESNFVCLRSGGVPSNAEDERNDFGCLQAFIISQETECQIQPLNSAASNPAIQKDLNDAVTVHHQAVDVSIQSGDHREILLLGGGVMGFAFGPCFSRYVYMFVFALPMLGEITRDYQPSHI